jgi:hypothetical protein
MVYATPLLPHSKEGDLLISLLEGMAQNRRP